MREAVRALEAMGLGEFVSVDMSIVRGLAYYTGTVFELHEKTGVERALAGGGLRNPALMVLLGGFLLRVTVLLASNSIAVHRVAGMP